MANHKKDTKMVTAVFRDVSSADAAYADIRSRGYDDERIHVMMSESACCLPSQEGEGKGKSSEGSLAAEGMGVGGAVGTVAGALATLAAAGSVLTLGGVVIAGPIAVALAGAGAGAAAGGVLGGLIGYGIPEGDARVYQDVVKNGGVVIGVEPRPNDKTGDIEDVLRNHHGEHVLTA